MARTIEAGTIFIKDDTRLPESLPIERDPYLKGWSRVKNLTSAALDKRLSEFGWTFFFLAGKVKAMAFGSNVAKTTRRAVGKVFANMKSGRFNSLEISRVQAKRFLGLRYVTVDAHLRHVQENIYLFHAKDVLAWVQSRPAAG